MSSKLRAIKRGQQKKEKMVLAIVDGSNVFSKDTTDFIPKSVAEKNGYVYVEGDTEEELWLNMIEKSNTPMTKELLIEKHKVLNSLFKKKFGKENVVEIAHKMCQIEDELLEVYGYKMFED